MKEKIVILGAGESGVGAALLAKQKGFDVFVSDGGAIKQILKMNWMHMQLTLKKDSIQKKKF